MNLIWFTSSPQRISIQFLASSCMTTHAPDAPFSQQVNVDWKSIIDLFPGTEDTEEHVEGDLDTIDEDETVLVGDELEVDGVDDGPDLPGSLAGTEEVGLDLGADGSEAIAVDEAEVGEEDGHEDGAPEDLVDSDLGEDGLGVGSLDLGIEPVVEVVAGGSVVDEAEDGEGDESLHVEGTARDEDLLGIESSGGGGGVRECGEGYVQVARSRMSLQVIR